MLNALKIARDVLICCAVLVGLLIFGILLYLVVGSLGMDLGFRPERIGR